MQAGSNQKTRPPRGQTAVHWLMSAAASSGFAVSISSCLHRANFHPNTHSSLSSSFEELHNTSDQSLGPVGGMELPERTINSSPRPVKRHRSRSPLPLPPAAPYGVTTCNWFTTGSELLRFFSAISASRHFALNASLPKNRMERGGLEENPRVREADCNAQLVRMMVS